MGGHARPERGALRRRRLPGRRRHRGSDRVVRRPRPLAGRPACPADRGRRGGGPLPVARPPQLIQRFGALVAWPEPPRPVSHDNAHLPCRTSPVARWRVAASPGWTPWIVCSPASPSPPSCCALPPWRSVCWSWARRSGA
nr:hypothetical protein [Mitsuaria sp. TWR114]